MKKFDTDNRCPKCGHSKATAIFLAIDTNVNRVKAGYPKNDRELMQSDEELISRKCCMCNYKWYELPLDAEE